MRSRNSKEGVLLLFKPYIVFVLLVILKKWSSQHNSFRICELCSFFEAVVRDLNGFSAPHIFSDTFCGRFFVNESFQCDYSFKG